MIRKFPDVLNLKKSLEKYILFLLNDTFKNLLRLIKYTKRKKQSFLYKIYDWKNLKFDYVS